MGYFLETQLGHQERLGYAANTTTIVVVVVVKKLH
jgi:hypothetical protein